MIVGEHLQIAFLLEATGLASRTPEVDSILSQACHSSSLMGSTT
jgi:hypothetical protein